MKITRRQLRRLINETIYVDPQGVAVRSQDIPGSVFRKDMKIAQSMPKLRDLMAGSREDVNMARELGRSFPSIDPGYHGAEDIFISDPEGFMMKNHTNTDSDEYYIILFDMYCDYENSELDFDLLAEAFTGRGLVYGEMLHTPTDKHPVQYIFGESSMFDDDPYNFLQNLIDYELDTAYSSEGFNRPCTHQLSLNSVYALGHPMSIDISNRKMLNKFVTKNYAKLNQGEQLALLTALTTQNPDQMKQVGSSDPEFAIEELRRDFMAHVADDVLNPAKGSVVEDVRYDLTYYIDSGAIF